MIQAERFDSTCHIHSELKSAPTLAGPVGLVSYCPQTRLHRATAGGDSPWNMHGPPVPGSPHHANFLLPKVPETACSQPLCLCLPSADYRESATAVANVALLQSSLPQAYIRLHNDVPVTAKDN